MTQQLGRTPAPEEVVRQLKLPPETVKILKRSIEKGLDSTRSVGLNALWSSSTASNDETSSPAETIDKERLNALLAAIDERQAEILQMHYGLRAGKALTLRQIGKKLKMSAERVRQLEAKALERLRRLLKRSDS